MLFPIPHWLLYLPFFLFCAVAAAKLATVLATEFLARPEPLRPAPPSAQIIYFVPSKTPLASFVQRNLREAAGANPRRAANGAWHG